MKKDNLEHYLSEAAKIRELGVSVEAVLVHLLIRSDMTVEHTMAVAVSLEQHRPALLQLLDEADGDGWMRLHQERELSGDMA